MTNISQSEKSFSLFTQNIKLKRLYLPVAKGVGYSKWCKMVKIINSIQDGGGGKKPLPRISFIPVTSTNAGISPQNFITWFIKEISKDSRKVKRIRNYVSKCNLYLYFLI